MAGMHPKDQLGRDGEDAACKHARGLGMRIVDRNWRCKHGELDIIARDGDAYVFIEVKTRRGTAYGHPFAAITRHKVRRLRQLCGLWMAAHDVRGPMRMDAVAVHAPPGQPMRVEYLRGIA